MRTASCLGYSEGGPARRLSKEVRWTAPRQSHRGLLVGAAESAPRLGRAQFRGGPRRLPRPRAPRVPECRYERPAPTGRSRGDDRRAARRRCAGAWGRAVLLAGARHARRGAGQARCAVRRRADAGRADEVDDGRLQHRARRARSRAGRRGRDERRRAFRPDRAAPRVGRANRHCARRRDSRRGHGPDAADRDLARLLGDRELARSGSDQGRDRAPDPRRRRPVGGGDPGRDRRARLLRGLVSEVALRTGRDRRARRRPTRRPARRAPELLRAERAPARRLVRRHARARSASTAAGSGRRHSRASPRRSTSPRTGGSSASPRSPRSVARPSGSDSRS